ncbi:MAG: hypothetical protein IV107_24100 [Paucibacter sp.]|nr:hypothetical protein [Roseateles sp.]
MPQIIVLKPFKFAHLGYQVEEFEPSDEPRETTQEVVDVLKDEGFFTVCGEEEKDGEPGKKPAAAASAPIAEEVGALPPAQPVIDTPPAEAAAAPAAAAPAPVKKPGKKPAAAA